MASVILPTRKWTQSARALLDQVRPGDELLVVCDDPRDPVATERFEAPSETTIRVITAGSPDRCSGKAHALAVGLDEATQDLVVFTDDDVDREADWLETLTGLADKQGAAAATPVFVSDGWRWQFLEPLMTSLGSALICRYGGAWGGGVAFRRDCLDEARYRRDLERTVSDDALLWDALDRVHTTPGFVNTVTVPSDPGNVRDRVTRFVLSYAYWLPRGTALLFVLSLVVLTLATIAPLPVAAAVTVGSRAAYRYLGVDRRTWLLAFPAALVLPLALATAYLNPSFTWGGRRYQWTGRYSVEIECDPDP